MTVATFVVAILGWVTATVSLTWNIISWLFSAGRAKVELRMGAVTASGYMTSPVQSDGWKSVEENLTLNGLQGEPAFFVVVRNTGRIPITVEGCSFRAGNGMESSTVGRPDWGVGAFPVRIEAGESETFAYRDFRVTGLMDVIKELPQKPRTGGLGEAMKPDVRSIRAKVQLGNGKSRLGRPVLRF